MYSDALEDVDEIRVWIDVASELKPRRATIPDDERGSAPTRPLCNDAREQVLARIGRVLRNRGAGPFGLLNLLDERCGGVFDEIDAVIPAKEREEFMSRYCIAAGFEKDRLNAAPSLSRPARRSPLPDRPSSQRRPRAAICQVASLQIPQSSPTK
jgi:hypothetical protein